jgi:hypothetical protein
VKGDCFVGGFLHMTFQLCQQLFTSPRNDEVQ